MWCVCVDTFFSCLQKIDLHKPLLLYTAALRTAGNLLSEPICSFVEAPVCGKGLPGVSPALEHKVHEKLVARPA